MITSSFDDVLATGELFFIYDDDRMALDNGSIDSITLSVEIAGSEIFSTSISVGTFSFDFSNSVLTQIQANQNTVAIILCVEDEDNETDCFTLDNGVAVGKGTM